MATKLKMETDSGSLNLQRISDLEKCVTDLTNRLKTAEEKNVQDDKVITYLNKQLNTRQAAPPVNPYSQKIATSRLELEIFWEIFWEIFSANFHFGENFVFWRKVRFLTKIFIFGENFVFDFRCLA